MNNRKLKNILVEPFKQIKIGLYLMLLNVLFGISSAAAFYYFISDYYKVVYNLIRLVKLPPEAVLALETQAQQVQIWAILILALICLLFIIITTFLALRWTHRMYGPINAINNQLRRLIQGENITRIELRKGDEFHETAALINQYIQVKK